MKKGRNILTDYGGKGEPIILLHGFLASSGYWRRLQPFLTRAGYRVVTIDLLGFGKAVDVPATSYDYTEHIQHIHKHVQSLPLKQPFVLVGHSMGALLAARYSLLYPDDVKRLFLLHPPLYKDREEVRTTLRGTGRVYRFLLDSRFRELGWKSMKYIPQIPISAHSFISREKSMTHIIESAEFIEDLTRLHVPTTLLLGSKDRAEYIQNLLQLAHTDAITVTIKNLSHHSPLFQPKVITQLITS